MFKLRTEGKRFPNTFNLKGHTNLLLKQWTRLKNWQYRRKRVKRDTDNFLKKSFDTILTLLSFHCRMSQVFKRYWCIFLTKPLTYDHILSRTHNFGGVPCHLFLASLWKSKGLFFINRSQKNDDQMLFNAALLAHGNYPWMLLATDDQDKNGKSDRCFPALPLCLV